MIAVVVPANVELSDVQRRRLSEEVWRGWLLYGELHLTNAGGRGLALIAPEAISYDHEALQRGRVTDLGEPSSWATQAGPGWWHPPACTDRHDEDHNCLDEGGSIIGWREAVTAAALELAPKEGA